MIGDTRESTAISLFDASKNAALYFDYVVPVTVGHDSFPEDEQSLLPPYLRGNSGDRPKIDDYIEVMRDYLRMHLLPQYEGGGSAEERLEVYWATVKNFLRERGLNSAPLLLPSQEVGSTGKQQEDILVSLLDLPMIDVENTSWDQIMEFRKDISARKKLRRLKVFLSKNYEGKERSFIQDDLQIRLEDYVNTTNDWGFETKISTLSILFSSKSLAGTGGAALVSDLLGSPDLASIAAVSGACIEIGKISLNLAKRRYGLATLRRDHPLGYLIEAEERFPSSLVNNVEQGAPCKNDSHVGDS